MVHEQRTHNTLKLKVRLETRLSGIRQVEAKSNGIDDERKGVLD